jgi:uncharacterized SAM-binding protein YcdF (DUF218 family)
MEDPMSIGTDSRNGALGQPTDQPRGSRPLRKLLLGLVVVALLAVIAVPLGFLWFISQVSTKEVALARNADGIVVLTGGTSRVNDAFELLASKRGRRLLITGVNPGTNPVEISRVMPEHRRLFACCVDLDHEAANTLGNAISARRWAEQQRFKSLIVVTSAYHMPRALAELEHQLPGIELVPFPVVPGKSRVEQWWTHPPTARLLFTEYVKYIVSAIRMRLDPHSDATAPSRFSDLRF